MVAVFYFPDFVHYLSAYLYLDLVSENGFVVIVCDTAYFGFWYRPRDVVIIVYVDKILVYSQFGC